MDADRYIKIVRLSALYDLVVTAAFVTPWTLALVHWVLTSLDTSLAIPGVMPPADALTTLFANLLGSVVVAGATAFGPAAAWAL